MDDFLILLQAKLDEAKSKKNINKDIDVLQKKLDKLKIQPRIDPKSISNLVKQLESVLNQKINISNISFDSKAAQQIGSNISQNIAKGINQSFESMSTSANNAEAEVTAAMDSIDHKLNKVKETGTGIEQNLFAREDVKSILDIIASLGNALDWLTDKLNLLETAGKAIDGFLGRDKSKQRFCPLWV